MAATSGTKWMSATTAVRKPSARSCRTMFSRFSPSRRPCAVRRTIFPPARSIRSIWATLAAVSLVSVLVIDWQATGCPPPIVVRPMRTSHAVRRMNFERFIGLSIGNYTLPHITFRCRAALSRRLRRRLQIRPHPDPPPEREMAYASDSSTTYCLPLREPLSPATDSGSSGKMNASTAGTVYKDSNDLANGEIIVIFRDISKMRTP